MSRIPNDFFKHNVPENLVSIPLDIFSYILVHFFFQALLNKVVHSCVESFADSLVDSVALLVEPLSDRLVERCLKYGLSRIRIS